MSIADRLAVHRSENGLTDGRTTVTYAALHAEFARLDALWRSADESGLAGVIALVGRNDVASAVAALHLLATERACYFWRPSTPMTGNAFPWSELPEFCTTAIQSRDPESATNGDSSGLGYVLEHRSTTLFVPKSSSIYLGTSGTTARPKLAVYTPERLLGNAENCVRRFQLTAADRVLLPLPIAHMYGLGAAFLPAVLAGASVCILPQANLLTFLQAEQRFDPTVVFLTPGLAHQLIAVRKQKRPYRLSILGADRMNGETFARYEERHGCTVCVYGSTELGAVAASSPDDAYERRRHSSGRLLDHVRLVSHPLETDATDTLCFEHPFAMAGYANANGDPELPADFYQQGVYLTRDVGAVDEHGDLRIQGRCDDSVKRDGYLVAFSYVEQALEQLPQISRAIVLAGEPTPRGVELIAFCVQANDQRTDEQQLRQECQTRLPAHAIPDRFHLLDRLPLTSTGKPDRQALRSLLKET